MSRRAERDLGRIIGMLAHTELASTDPDATTQFIRRVFGWETEEVAAPAGKLVRYRTPGGARGSIRSTRSGEPPATVNYILVEDIRATLEKVKDAKGEIVMPVADVPQMGSFFWFKVPGGPLLAAWQDAPLCYFWNIGAKGLASKTTRIEAIFAPSTRYHSQMNAVPAGVFVTMS